MSIPSATFALTVLLIVLQFLVGTWWNDRLWGINHLSFFSETTQIFACSAALGIATLGFHFRDKLADLRGIIPINTPTAYVTLLLITLFLVWKFQTSHELLGDSFLISRQVIRDFEFTLNDKNNVHVYALLHKLLTSLHEGFAWRDTFVLVSCSGGLAYLVCTIYIAEATSKNLSSKACIIIIATSTGLMQIFFGYVEEYVPILICLSVICLCLIRWNGERLGWLMASFGGAATAIWLHPLAFFATAAPGFAGAWQGWRWSHGSTIRQGYFFLGCCSYVLAICALVLFKMSENSSFILDLSEQNGAYSLLSVHHLNDMLNFFLLTLPLHGPFCIMIMWFSRSASWWRDPIIISLLLFAAGGWLTTFFIEPMLGSLDWDMMSIYVIPFGFLTAYVAAKYVPQNAIVGTTVCFASGAFLHLVPWIAVNASEKRSVAMVQSMTENDYHHRGDRNVKLGLKLREAGFEKEALYQFEKALSHDKNNLLALYNLGMTYLGSNQTEKGLIKLREFVATSDEKIDTRLATSIIAFYEGFSHRAILLCAEYVVEHPSYSRGLRFAAFLLQRTTDDKDRLLIESALSFATGNHIGAISKCTKLIREHGADKEVQMFAEGLIQWIQLQKWTSVTR